MFDFSKYSYNFQNNQFEVGTEPMVFHCHHYNTFLQRSILDADYIDSQPFLVGAAAESSFLQLRELFKAVSDISERKKISQEIYRLSGFGIFDLSKITERGGEVRTKMSHY